jgi:hypothetical protein
MSASIASSSSVPACVLDGHEIGHGHVALEDAYVAPAPDVRDVPGELSLRLGYLDLLHMTR